MASVGDILDGHDDGDRRLDGAKLARSKRQRRTATYDGYGDDTCRRAGLLSSVVFDGTAEEVRASVMEMHVCR
jgi:hypothetical protein